MTDHDDTRSSLTASAASHPAGRLLRESLVGKIFGGQYRILSELSRGGMGAVYRAEQISLGREVALKVVLAGDSPESNRRFLLEASHTAKLTHPNVVHIFDFGRTQDGVLFLVMELLSGQTLKDWVQEHGPLSVKDCLHLARGLCGALAEAHGEQIIHRDIKPSNIMVSPIPGVGLSAKLIDFGLVKSMGQSSGLSQTGQMMGTPMYMAPEQITASGVDDRVDLYALGLTLYFALTGRSPYPQRSLEALLHAQVHEVPEPMELEDSPLTCWIVEQLIAKRPSQRFQNALQLMEALRICEEHLREDDSPLLRLEEGVLCSDTAELSEALVHRPMVGGDCYLGDGSGISENFEATLALSPGALEDQAWRPATVSSSGALPAPEPQLPGPTPPAETSTGPGISLFPGLWYLLLAMALGLFFLQQSESQPEVTPAGPQTQLITLKSDPTGASVYREGNLKGSTPFQTLLLEGKVETYTLELEGFQHKEVELSTDVPVVTVRLDAEEAAPLPSDEEAETEEPEATETQTARGYPEAAPRLAPQPVPVPAPPEGELAGPRDPWSD